FDARGRGLKTAKTWSSSAGFDERAAFQAGSYPAHLLVNDLHVGDQGLFRCRVDFRYSPTRNALVNLTVVVPPTPPIIYDDLGREISSVVGPYVEGSDVILKCAVSGGKPDPVVSWYVNGELEDSTYHVNRFGDVINELAFRTLNRSHLGSQFSCRASNTRLIQPVEKSVVLDLNLKPLFVRMRQRHSEKLQAGMEYRLVCETAGSKPPATLKWIKGGKEITQVSTQDLDAGNITQSTFLFVPTPQDNGASIICRAENPWLNRSHILEEIWSLNVVYPPEVKLSLGSTLNPMEIKEGTDVYFECKIHANPKISRLVWLFNIKEKQGVCGTEGEIERGREEGHKDKELSEWICVFQRERREFKGRREKLALAKNEDGMKE
ncbi:Nephrin, partial [Orchesella cincta]